MRNSLVILAAGVALGAVVVFLLSSRDSRPRPAALSPLPAPYYSVLFENDHVRVVEHRLEPGDSEPMHSHPPMVVYFMGDASVRISGPDDEQFEESLAKGQVMRIGATSHAIENIGDTPLHSLLVEIKNQSDDEGSSGELPR